MPAHRGSRQQSVSGHRYIDYPESAGAIGKRGNLDRDDSLNVVEQCQEN